MAVELGKFDGRDVRKTSIAVTNAGDGLSAALRVDPRVLHHGDEVYVVMKCDVAKVRFDPIGDGEDLARVHVLKAGTATIVDKDLVQAHIEAQVERIVAARDDETGAQQLDLNGKKGKDVAELEREHKHGIHKRKRRDCPLCHDPLGVDGEKEEEPAPKRGRGRPRKLAAVE